MLATGTISMITLVACSRSLHSRSWDGQVEMEAHQQRGGVSKVQGTTMNRFSILKTGNLIEKRDINNHEISCHLLAQPILFLTPEFWPKEFTIGDCGYKYEFSNTQHDVSTQTDAKLSSIQSFLSRLVATIPSIKVPYGSGMIVDFLEIRKSFQINPFYSACKPNKRCLFRWSLLQLTSGTKMMIPQRRNVSHFRELCHDPSFTLGYYTARSPCSL